MVSPFFSLYLYLVRRAGPVPVRPRLPKSRASSQPFAQQATRVCPKETDIYVKSTPPPSVAQSLSSLFCVLWWYLDHCPLLPFSSSSCLFCAAANQQGRERRASRRRTIVIGRR